MKWIISAGCLLLALFCVYGLLASGELSGTRQILWRSGYGIVGVLALLGAVVVACRGK